jgi:hypothetical protein
MHFSMHNPCICYFQRDRRNRDHNELQELNKSSHTQYCINRNNNMLLCCGMAAEL